VAFFAGEASYSLRQGGKVNKRIVKSLVVLSALWGAWSVAATDEEDSARHDRDRPVAKLIDANGKLVGKLVYFDAYGALTEGGVVLSIQGALVYAGIHRITTLFVESASQLQWSGVHPQFSGPNCSGTVYIPSATGPLRPTAIVRNGATATLYVASGAPTQMVTVRSEDASLGCSPYDSPSQSSAWTVESTFDLTQHYPEPLRVGF
jgi:hypothetical protein